MFRIAGLVLCCLFFATNAHAVADDRDGAVAAAQQWLSQVDSGDIEGSWNAAGEALKEAVTLNEWRNAATNIRTPLGDQVARTFNSARHTNVIPGRPRADYFVIVFNSRYSESGSANETVTVVDENGTWRVVGYYVH